MKKHIYLFVLLTCLLVITGCGNKKEEVNSNIPTPKVEIKTDGEVYQDKMPSKEDDIIKNLDIKFEKAKNNTYVMFIKNNNTFVIPDIEIKVNFKKNGSVIDTAKDGHDAVLPGYTVVSDFSSFESFDDADYDISIEWDNSYKNHSDKVKVDYNLNSSKECLVTVTNNDSEKIDEVEVVAVFYDSNGNLLGSSFAEDITKVGSGKSETVKLSLKKYVNDEDIDKVVVYLNQAHTFGI